jgi:TRAP-type C4-dicarboxylate transport system permease small subunit
MMSTLEEVAIFVLAYLIFIGIVVKVGEIAVKYAINSKKSSKNRRRG